MSTNKLANDLRRRYFIYKLSKYKFIYIPLHRKVALRSRFKHSRRLIAMIAAKRAKDYPLISLNKVVDGGNSKRSF